MCPFDTYCLSDTSWQNDFTIYIKITISRRRATAVYSRSNYTILDIQNASSPEPTTYDPIKDFFPIYDMAMYVPPNLTDVTTALDYMSWICGQGISDSYYDAHMLLRQLISVPVGLFNDVYAGVGFPPDNQNTTGSLSIPAYRVPRSLQRG